MSINPELGIFARMPNGIDGLIRLKDVSWINPSIVLPSISVGVQKTVDIHPPKSVISVHFLSCFISKAVQG